ncbi:MAG TPA: DUF3592 domain-containing protein [Ktedonobacterales bacterium]|jgi:hypothetical protein
MIGRDPFAARATRRGRSPAKIVGLIFLGLSLIPLAIGLFFLVDTLHFLGSATASATGSIVACQYPKSSSSACMPTVVFTTARGEQITFSESFASSGFAVGQQQPVAYDPANPQGARIANFLTLWFVPTLLLGLGGLFLLIGGVGSAIGFWRRRQALAG